MCICICLTYVLYASLTLSSSLFRFFYYALSENRNTCFVFNSITKYIENMTITEFNLIEASIKEINDQINRLSRHIKHQYYIFLFVLSSIAYSIVFILIYLVIVIIQVNSVFKDDDAAIRFLASKEKLSMMVLERTEQSWQILSQFVNDKAALESLKIDPNTTVGISMQPSKFNLNESENNSNKSIMTNTPNTTRTNTPNITRTNTPNTTRTNTPNTTRTSTPNSTVNNSNNNENPDLKITTSASSCVEKSNNLLLSPSNTPSLSLQKTEGSPGVPAAAAPNPSLMMLPKAELTGLNPINNDNLLNNHFVAELSPEIEKFIKQKRNLRKNDELNINCQFITDFENINNIDKNNSNLIIFEPFFKVIKCYSNCNI